MGIIADLHIHSKYSRACSKNIDVGNLSKYAEIKGIDILGTGDFTHPEWMKELKEKLKEKNKGVYEFHGTKFILSSEISLMYKQDKPRKVHLVLLAPDLSIVNQINKWLITKGRLDYDGRPIFGFSCIELADKMREIDDKIEIIPAHAWTPWFGIFGSMSGFDSLKECFKEQLENIHAIETGMSSDPEMNWHISELNNKSIVSFSDSHSFWPWRLGREATIFKGDDSIEYKDIIKQIRENSFEATIETNPSYGKYHFDGHRLCNFSCSPAESKKLKNICPICKKGLTIGVENRIEELSDNPESFKPKKARPFHTMLPLHELISMVKGTSMTSKMCWSYYNKFIDIGNEFNILLQASRERLLKIDDKICEAIMDNREGKIKVIPGYDGEYGKAVMKKKQMTLA